MLLEMSISRIDTWSRACRALFPTPVSGWSTGSDHDPFHKVVAKLVKFPTSTVAVGYSLHQLRPSKSAKDVQKPWATPGPTTVCVSAGESTLETHHISWSQTCMACVPGLLDHPHDMTVSQA